MRSKSLPEKFSMNRSLSNYPSCYRFLLIFLLFSFSVTNISAAAKTFTGGVGFTFGDATKWTGGTLPVAGDNLTINGICIIDNNVATDNIAYGTLIIGGTSAGTLSWAVGGTNRLNVTNVSSGFAGSTFNMTNGGKLIIRGTWSSANLGFTPGLVGTTGTIEIQSSMTLPAAYTTYNTLIINGAGTTVTLGATFTANSNLTITSGTLDLSTFTANRTTAGGTITISDGATLKIGGTNTFPSNYTTKTWGVTGTSTVDYSGTAQTVGIQNYDNLTLSNSGVKTFGAGNIRILSTFTISGTATADLTTNLSTLAYWGNGAQTVLSLTYYNLSFDGSGGSLAKTLAGNVIVNSDLSIVNSATVDLGSFTINRASSGGTLTLSGAAATLKIGGTNTFPSNYSTHVIGATSTVEYNGTTQSVAVLNSAQNYGKLIISGSGTKTLAGTAIVAGNLTISSGTFDLGSNTINRLSAGGTLTVSNGAILKIGGTNTFPSNYNTHSIGATSTVEYSGTTQSVIVLNTAQNYGHLIISGSGTKTLAGTNNVAGDLTVSAGTFDLGNFTANRSSAGGTITISNGAILKIGGTNPFPTNYSTKTLGATSTVDFSGTAQAVLAQNYGHLTLSNSGAKTFASGTIGIAGTFTISGTATADMTTNTPTVDFNGSGSQTILAQTYYNLTSSNAGTKTLAGNTIVNNNLTVSGSSTLDLSTFTANRASAGGTLSIASTATLKIGGTNTFPSNYSTHSIAFVSIVEYAGTNQIIGVLNSAQEYSSLTISGSGTKTLTADLNVAGTITLTSGSITTGAYTLYSKVTGNVFRISGYVYGNLKRRMTSGSPSKIFYVGDATNYTPITVVFAGITTAGDLTVSTTSGDHATINTSTINSGLSVNRTWTMTNTGIVFTTYDATFTFVAGDLDAGATTANFIVGKYSSGWTNPTVGTKNPTNTQSTGLTSFGDFQLGEPSIPVPLKLVSFDGERRNDNTYLHWISENELNVDHFELQKSNDARIFAVIGTVRARNSGNRENYEHVDGLPLNGVAYYQLRSVDIDSKYSYSKVIAVTANNNGTGLIIQSPSRNLITILNKTIYSGPFEYSLYNQNGQLIIRGITGMVPNGTSVISLATPIANGIYFLWLKNNTTSFKQKLLVSD